MPKAQNLYQYAGQFLALMVLSFMVPTTIQTFRSGFDRIFDVLTMPASVVFVDSAKGAMWDFAMVAGPIFMCVLVSAVLCKVIYQGGLIFSVEPMNPKLEKINPISGFKRIFGRRGWVELAISTIRVGIWTACFAGVFFFSMDILIGTSACPGICLVDPLIRILVVLLTAIFILLALYAILEVLIQGSLFAKEQRMTKTEVKNEQKEQMPSKEVRRERNRFRKEIEETSEAVGVDKATFALFFGDMAIGIRYDSEVARIPRLSAKARTREESIKLRKTIANNGFLETDSEAVVVSLIKKPLGEPVPPSLHPDLIEALRRMFGGG